MVNYNCRSTPAGDDPITPALLDPDGKLTNYTINANCGTLSVGPLPSLNIKIGDNENATIHLNTIPGLTYRVDISNDLIQWEPLTNITATTTEIEISDPSKTLQTKCFYRAIAQ
jgi:hypothetical protein